MAGEFLLPITIKKAIDSIVDRTYLLPSIQRKFVWKSEQVEKLFDSIMQNYPISSFMFWDVKDNTVKTSNRFYQFLTEYREFFHDTNQAIDTKGYSDFIAVIDGQQRLTALFLGLKGTYAYKTGKGKKKDTQEKLPTRWLYLNIYKPLEKSNEHTKMYDFRFLTQDEHKKLSRETNDIWFKVNDILDYENDGKLDRFIESNEWKNNDFAKDTIRLLRKKIFDEKLISYYLESTQEIDVVLDIFVRVNSGGEPLSLADLLMSMMAEYWKQKDVKKEIHNIIQAIFNIGTSKFDVTKDFILKSCLYLFSNDVKFSIANFKHSTILEFEHNWDRIHKSIIESFKLLESWGFDNDSFPAKNAALPIVYYIYKNDMEDKINNNAKLVQEKKQIRKWLNLSLLKGIFSAHSDQILTKIRNVLEANLGDNIFPLEQIKNKMESDPAKNLTFDDTFMHSLLSIQKDKPKSYVILSLLYSHLDFGVQKPHKDHLHPISSFNKKQNKEQFLIADSILNLQLHYGDINNSKNNISLKEWVNKKIGDKDRSGFLKTHLIPDVDLSLENFSEFIEVRKKILVEKLESILN